MAALWGCGPPAGDHAAGEAQARFGEGRTCLFSAATMRSHIMVSTMAPPTTQPAVAAVMGLSVVSPSRDAAPQLGQVVDVGAG